MKQVKFKVGDIVKHKTSFIQIMVIEVLPLATYYCSWINSITGERTEDEFLEFELEKV